MHRLALIPATRRSMSRARHAGAQDRALTAEEKAAILRGALSDKALRSLERDRGLPAGSLEP